MPNCKANFKSNGEKTSPISDVSEEEIVHTTSLGVRDFLQVLFRYKLQSVSFIVSQITPTPSLCKSASAGYAVTAAYSGIR
jgi:hypothetical protein